MLRIFMSRVWPEIDSLRGCVRSQPAADRVHFGDRQREVGRARFQGKMVQDYADEHGVDLKVIMESAGKKK